MLPDGSIEPQNINRTTMMRLLFLTIVTCFSYALYGQYWSKLFDNIPRIEDSIPGSLDAIRFVDVQSNQVVTLSYLVGNGIGGFVFRRLNRKDGAVLAEKKYMYEDTVFGVGSVIQIHQNRYAILYNNNFWGAPTNGYYWLHYVDSMGETLNRHRLSSFSFGVQLEGAVKTPGGFVIASTSFPPTATSNSYIEYIGNQGQPRWSQTVVPMSTRSFEELLIIKDTIALLQSSGTGPRVFLFDTLGNELKRSDAFGYDLFGATDFTLSSDSSIYYLAGGLGPLGSNPQVVMSIDRGLNEIRYNEISVGTGGLARNILQNRHGDLLLVGHARNTVLYNDRDNAFVMLLNPSTLAPKSVNYFTPTGNLKDNGTQIILTATLEDSILYIAGHGGITDTTGSQDEWILALTEHGTCDTADCYPWLVAGMEDVPSAWMHDWSIGTGTDGWHVRLERPELHQPGSKMVVMNLQGQTVLQQPIEAAAFRIPFAQLPTGTYIVQWQQGSKRMYKRALRP